MDTPAIDPGAIQPIGLIRTPFATPDNMPVQPAGARETLGQAVLDEAFVAGLRDLEGFSHIFLIYLFHRVNRTELQVVPFLDTVPRGVFATRSPLRPNHIGISVVQLLSIDGPVLHLQGVDMLDKTPLLDIKPYIAAFDQVNHSRSGWMTASTDTVAATRSDKRFL